jgi:hypothetical protein
MANGSEKRKKKKTLSGHFQTWREEVNKSIQGGLKIGGVPFYKSIVFLKGLLAIGVILILSFLLLPDIQFIPARYQIGNISPKNIKASQDFDVPDLQATEEKRIQVMEGVLSVYDFDISLVNKLERRCKDAFAVMSRYYTGKRLREQSAAQQTELNQADTVSRPDEPGALEPQRTEQEIFTESYNEFERILKISLPDSSFKVFESETFSPELAALTATLLKKVMNQGIVSSPELLLNDADKGIILMGLGENFEKVITDVSIFLDLKMAREVIQNYTDPLIDALPPETANAVKELASSLIVPNLTFNKNGSDLRKIEASEDVKTVFFKIQKGEMIVREGERITESHMAKLNALNVTQKESNLFRVFIGLLFFNAILLTIFVSYINRFKREITGDLQKLALLGLIVVSSVGLIKAFYWIARVIMANVEIVEPSSVLYAIPFAFCGMIIGVLFEIRIFIFPILIISILSGVMIGEDLTFTLYSLVGNVIAAMTVQDCRRRTALWRGGILIGGVNVLTALSISMVHNELTLQTGMYDVIFAFSGGIIVSILVSGMVPILENLFKITTDIRLLELSDTNQRVLKDLLVHAPGTYQHSLMVGNLAEEAAEAVGANPLLTRVSSLYHDIGKIQKAEYFVENQLNLENRHDKLAPSMSALILTAHVKDGVELARESKLPPAILDIIRQHHGSSLITFFYQKAKDHEDPNIHAIKEEDYRYPGPKPQTKEAAIVMICDVIEAASRVLTNPTPSRIEGMVNKILERIYLDGQLDDCDLTLKDLRLIKKSLIPILNSIYHHRIDYPSVKLAENGGGSRKDERQAQPAAPDAKGSTEPGEVSLEKSLRNRP